MTVGDPSIFAIESGITEAYERPSFRALGFFVIHIDGRRYGVYEPEATMLGCSFDEVQNRIIRRGSHTAPFAAEPSGSGIARAFCEGLYSRDHESERFFDIPQPEFAELFYSNKFMWAPDGDEAFDDSSYVLHFDVDERIRLIAFRRREGNCHDPGTLSDIWLPAEEFYANLQRWHVAFESEWLAMPKVSAEKEELRAKRQR